jgi:hypothetical protein
MNEIRWTKESWNCKTTKNVWKASEMLEIEVLGIDIEFPCLRVHEGILGIERPQDNVTATGRVNKAGI